MRSATVLVDATAIPADRGGVGRYVEELAAHLGGQVHIAVQRRDVQRFAQIAPDARLHVQSSGIESAWRRLLWEQIGLPRLARRIRPDVVHSPHYTMPLLWRGHRVVTFHDATFFSDPHVHSPIKRVFFRLWCRISSSRADAIIVPSHASASEFARFLPRGADRYDVAYHGVDRSEFSPQSSERIAAAAAAHGLAGRRWIAFLGTIEPRKNVEALIRGYARAVADVPDPPVLALAGARGWATGVEEAASEVKEPAAVLRLGFVPSEHLPALLSGAELVAYPSLGEGFGLPVLEAMACAAPVLTTRRLALEEVGGTAVAYTDVDAMAIGHAIAALLADPARRDAMAHAGFQRSADFTWQTSAAAHRAVYDRVAGAHR